MNKVILYMLLGVMIHHLFAQEYKDIVYPYGGIKETGRFKQNMKLPPLRFGIAGFYEVIFTDSARFCHAYFVDSAFFKNSQFAQPVYFNNSIFDGRTSFDNCSFKNTSDFKQVDFNNHTYFSNNYFNNKCLFDSSEFSMSVVFIKNRFYKDITFHEAKFQDETYIKNMKTRGSLSFTGANFSGSVFFEGFDIDKTFLVNQAKFHKPVQFKKSVFSISHFKNTVFYEPVLFDNIHFNAAARFLKTIFKDTVSFKYIISRNLIDFGQAKFNHVVDFREVDLNRVNLERAVIGGEFWLGSNKKHLFDFSRSLFQQNAKIVLFDVAHLKIQAERIKFITLADELSYSMKSLIITELKDSCFADDKKSQLELDYIFAKSTMYQRVSDDVDVNKWYYIWKWPKWISITIYNFAMGMGYRPFRVIFWWLVIMLLFSFWFYKKMPFQICRYLFKSKFKKKEDDSGALPQYNKWDMLINCIYFSCLIFFSIRLQSDILIEFKGNAKTIIIVEWFIGLLGYAAFITLSKSGSILHTLTSFVLG